jgi:hypothetical protein
MLIIVDRVDRVHRLKTSWGCCFTERLLLWGHTQYGALAGRAKIAARSL